MASVPMPTSKRYGPKRAHVPHKLPTSGTIGIHQEPGSKPPREQKSMSHDPIAASSEDIERTVTSPRNPEKTFQKLKDCWARLKSTPSSSLRLFRDYQSLPCNPPNDYTPVKTFGHLGNAVSTMEDSQVAYITSDLDELILSFFIQRRTWGILSRNDQYGRNYIKTNMRELGALSLVCRKWASICQPRLFQYLSLKNRQDLDNLHAFISSPASRIRMYLDIVLCCRRSSDTETPWFHTTCLKLRPPHLSPPPRIFARVENRHSAKLKSTFQSPYPRHLPPTVLSLSRLVLRRVHFDNFQKVIRVITELPSLSSIKLEGITWDLLPDSSLPLPTHSISRCKWRCRESWMRECTDNSGSLWLSALALPNSMRCLQQQEAHALCLLVSALMKYVNIKGFTNTDSFSFRVANGIEFVTYGSQLTKNLIPRIWIYLAPEGRSEWVRFITLDFESYRNIGYEKLAGHSRWGTVDEQLSKLRNIETLFLVFRREKNLRHFASHILKSHMPRLRASKKTKFLLSRSARADGVPRWLFCTPATVDEDIGGGAWLDLHDVEEHIGVEGTGLIFREFPRPDAYL